MKRLGGAAAAITAMLLSVVPALALADSNTGGVSGYVRVRHFGDGAISAVPRATVTVTGAAGEWQAETGENGFFAIFGIPPGRYLISADTERYYLKPPGWSAHHVCVHAAENRDVSLMLLDAGNARIDFWWHDLSWLDYMTQLRPDGSQTADLYSIGDCR